MQHTGDNLYNEHGIITATVFKLIQTSRPTSSPFSDVMTGQPFLRGYNSTRGDTTPLTITIYNYTREFTIQR